MTGAMMRRMTGAMAQLMRFGPLLLVVALGGCADPVDRADARIAGLRVGALLGDADVEGFDIAATIRQFRFPDDHGAHPGFRSEWWYLTLMLVDERQREYGAQFTVFRQALWPEPVSTNPWQNNQAYLGHFALTDVAAGQHVEFERMARGHPRLAGVGSDPFRLWLDGWQLHAQESGSWRLGVNAAGLALDVTLEPAKPMVLRGDRGLSHKGPGQASYYYSIPRLSVSGTLEQDGRQHNVSGSAWFDREWSTSVLGGEQLGWDWFALQFDDNTELSVFQLRRRDGLTDPHDQGVLVDAAGTSRRLGPADFSLEVVSTWTDELGVNWPLEWSVSVAQKRWRVVAAVADQRMDTSILYWEGLVHVYDQADNRVGRGFMELTGYGDE